MGQRYLVSVSAFPAATSAAAGVGDGPLVFLSGSSGTPNTSTDTSIAPNVAEAWWQFKTDGTVWRIVSSVGTQWNTGTEWEADQPTPGDDYWIRATLLAGGDAPTSGPSLGTWHKVAGSGSVTRKWTWETDGSTGEDIRAGTLKIDIADDSGGTNILATGHYRCNVSQIPQPPE